MKSLFGLVQPGVRLGDAIVALAADDRRAQCRERAADGGAEQHDRDEDLDERRGRGHGPAVAWARAHRAVPHGSTIPPAIFDSADIAMGPDIRSAPADTSPTAAKLVAAVRERTAQIQHLSRCARVRVRTTTTCSRDVGE